MGFQIMPDPTYPEYVDLRAEADKRHRPTVDPFDVHSRIPNLIHRRGHEWALAVLGREYFGVGSLYGSDMELLKLADERDLDPPLPQWVIDARQRDADHRAELEERRRAARQRDVEAWAAVAANVTVDLAVHTNTKARVRRGEMHYLAHAVPTADAYSGTRRIRTHRAGRALCETENRPKPLSLDDRAEPAGTPVTCVRCLDWASKVRAGRGQGAHGA